MKGCRVCRMACLTWLAVVSAGPLGAQNTNTLRLELITTYGWSDLSEAAEALSVNDRRLNAGELGAAGRAVEGQDGRVFVLDPVNRKVAVFDPRGLYLRAFGGDGEGPGEFRRPGRIAAGPDGTVYVWDAQLKRISRFAADGKLLSVLLIPTAPALGDFAVAQGRAWFVRLALKKSDAVLAFDLSNGARVDSFAVLSEPEVSLSSHGAPGSIAANTAGGITYAGPSPGELRTWVRGVEKRSGTNRFPDARGLTSSTGTRHTPVSMRAITTRPDGSYALVYSTSEIGRGEVPGALTFWLEILAPDGTSRGRTELRGVGMVGGLSATANGDLLLSVSEEYPHVRRLRATLSGVPEK